MLEGCVLWPDEFVKMYKEKGYWEDITLGEHLDRWVDKYADRPAISSQGQQITYRQMSVYATRLAYHMARMGIKTYDRVIFQLFNGPEVCYLFYACMKLGAIPISSLVTHRWAEISFFAEKAEARVHAIPAGVHLNFDYEEFADEVCNKIQSMEFVLTVGQPKSANMVSINDLIQKEVDLTEANEFLAQFRPDPMEPALFQLSGGTTGTPKLIPRTHNDYYYNAKNCAIAQGISKDDRILLPTPMTHNFPLVCLILPTHLMGGCVVPSILKPEIMLTSIRDNSVNVSGVLPDFLKMSQEEKKSWSLDGLKKLHLTGVPPEAQLVFRDFFNCDSLQTYGMAEGLICWTRPDDSVDVKTRSQGRPISEADEVKIVDIVTGEELPSGEKGEVWVRGPYTVRGYYKASERNEDAFTPDGFYKTGDLAIRDQNGNITWSGRIKDCIDRGGEKINAEEVENHIRFFPKVKEVAVVAMPDKRFGEAVCTFVVPQEGETFKLEDLRDFLLNDRRIAKFKAPERLEFIDELPRTQVGKFEKKSLREKIAQMIKEERA